MGLVKDGEGMSDTKSSSGNETGHVVSRHSLEALANRIAALESQLTEAQRREGLLRAVAEAAEKFRRKIDSPDNTIHIALKEFVFLQDALLTAKEEAAIDGGVMGE